MTHVHNAVESFHVVQAEGFSSCKPQCAPASAPYTSRNLLSCRMILWVVDMACCPPLGAEKASSLDLSRLAGTWCWSGWPPLGIWVPAAPRQHAAALPAGMVGKGAPQDPRVPFPWANLCRDSLNFEYLIASVLIRIKVLIPMMSLGILVKLVISFLHRREEPEPQDRSGSTSLHSCYAWVLYLESPRRRAVVIFIRTQKTFTVWFTTQRSRLLLHSSCSQANKHP